MPQINFTVNNLKVNSLTGNDGKIVTLDASGNFVSGSKTISDFQNDLNNITATTASISGNLQSQISTITVPTSSSFIVDYDSRYVNTSGDTMSGDLTITKDTDYSKVILNSNDVSSYGGVLEFRNNNDYCGSIYSTAENFGIYGKRSEYIELDGLNDVANLGGNWTLNGSPLVTQATSGSIYADDIVDASFYGKQIIRNSVLTGSFSNKIALFMPNPYIGLTDNNSVTLNDLTLASTTASISGGLNTRIATLETYRTGELINLFTPAVSQSPSANFATFDERQDGITVLDFDDTANETTRFSGYFDTTYSGGNVTVSIYWSPTSASTGTVVWGTQFDNDVDVVTTYAAQVTGATATSSSTAINVTNITHTSSQIDGCVAGSSYRLQLQRVANSGSDTMVGDAELHKVVVRNG
jgi:hypothetical protein